MNPFDRIDDYDYVISLARQQFPSIDFQPASRATSGWNNSTIEIRDVHNNLLCSFDSAEYLRYRARIGRAQAGSHPSSGFVSPATAGRDPSLIPVAARTARSMIGLVRGISYLFSGAILLSGLLLALQAVSLGNGAEVLVIFLLAGLVALVSHWIVKFTYIGLEMLADISEDLRMIRLSSSPGE